MKIKEGIWSAQLSKRDTWLYTIAFTFLCTAPAQAESTADVPNVGQLGTELVALAVIVVVVESALTTIFQWRVYKMLFNDRSVKTIVMVVVGLTVVLGFNYDVFAKIMALVMPSTTVAAWSGKVSTALSALIIAGGSAGVNTLLQRLGIRNPVLAEPERPVLNNDEAWISVKVKRASAIGPVQISVRELADDPQAPLLAGTVRERKFMDRLREAFFADAMRFPAYGGRTVKAGKNYEVIASGTRAIRRDGSDQKEVFSELIYKGGFAPRAIIDFSVSL